MFGGVAEDRVRDKVDDIPTTLAAVKGDRSLIRGDSRTNKKTHS